MTENHTRVYVQVQDERQWYDVIRDANQWFGPGNWRGQKHIRRKFAFGSAPVNVWFEVPDPKFASYLSLKYSGTAQLENR